jgi:hypothetical protein
VKQVIVLADAARDLELGRDFYDAQQLGIGDYFVDSLLSDLERLRLFHGIHPRHFGFYRMLANRFPFGIYYDETAQAVQVFAVLDLRSDPLWIREELTLR